MTTLVALEFDFNDDLTQRQLEDYYTALIDRAGEASHDVLIRRLAVEVAYSCGWFLSPTIAYTINADDEAARVSGKFSIDGLLTDIAALDIKALQALGRWIMDKAAEYNDIDPN